MYYEAFHPTLVNFSYKETDPYMHVLHNLPLSEESYSAEEHV